MVGVKRTYNCKKCGEVLFRLNKLNGGMQIICENCNKTKEIVEFDKYTSFLSNCKICGCNLVKVSVEVSDNFEEYMVPKCSECRSEIEKVKIDDNRNVIDLETYKILIDKHERKVLEERLEELEYKNENLEEKNYYLEEEVERLSDKLNYKKRTINNLKNEIESFEWDLEEKDKIISSLKDELESEQCKVEDLESEIEKLRYK